MLRRIPRSLRRAVLVTVLLAVTASVVQSWTAGTPGSGGWISTPSGPLGPADRDLLVKVRLAGLWEGPTGQQAQLLAGTPAVKEVGGHLSGEHADLDEEVRQVADRLGVPLPTAPNAQQLAWMEELSTRSGTEYDRMFVQRLREAHGAVLPEIAQVRTATRNDEIRAFATTAEEYVSRHLDYLESTGLVDYTALPEAPSPGLLSGEASLLDLLVPALVFLAAVLAALGVMATIRTDDPDRRVGAARGDAARAAAIVAIPAQRTRPHGPDPPAAERPRTAPPRTDRGRHALHP